MFGRAGDDRDQFVVLAVDADDAPGKVSLEGLREVLAGDARAPPGTFRINGFDHAHRLAPVVLYRERTAVGRHDGLGPVRQGAKRLRFGPAELGLDFRSAAGPQHEAPHLPLGLGKGVFHVFLNLGH